MNFVVLSSAKGTTFQAILDRIADRSLTAKCLGLISDRETNGCVEKARKAGIPFHIVEKQKRETMVGYDKRVHETIFVLEKNKGTFIILIGWFSILSPWFVQQFPNRILNVHPALLPKFGGKGMYGIKVHETVLQSGERESGMTIHLVTEDVDAGPILIQKKCPVCPGDTPATLKTRVQELEKEWYPKLLQMIEEGKLKPSATPLKETEDSEESKE